MTRLPPNAVTLDAMILGTDADEDQEAWSDLLASPGAALAWRTAVGRRGRIDAFALAIANHPWLADASLTLRRGMRRLARGTWPGAHVTMDSPLLATLAGMPSHGVSLAQGETRTLEVPVGTEVRIALPEGTHLQRVTSYGAETFDHPGWHMERGDDLVVLVAVRDDGTPAATLILVEAGSEETAD